MDLCTASKNSWKTVKVCFGLSLSILATEAYSLENNQLSILYGLEHRSIESDLSFYGEVSSVKYRLSESGIAHTFTEFKVREIFSGSYSGESIIIRTVGGLFYEDGAIKELHATEMPMFATGDSAILFMKNNGNSECPFYSCESGVYFVIDGKLAQSKFYQRGAAAITPLSRPEPISGVVTSEESTTKIPVVIDLGDALDRLRSIPNNRENQPAVVSLNPDESFMGVNIRPSKRPDVYPEIPVEVRNLSKNVEGVGQ